MRGYAFMFIAALHAIVACSCSETPNRSFDVEKPERQPASIQENQEPEIPTTPSAIQANAESESSDSSANQDEARSQTQTETSNPSDWHAIDHSFFDQQRHDSLIKAQIVYQIGVEPAISETDLRRLIEGLFGEAQGERDFRYHSRPTNVFIYCYVSREHFESGMGQWVGMLSHTPSANTPSITIRTDRLAAAVTDHEVIDGLDENTRKLIWSELVQAEDRAREIADQRRPIKIGATEHDILANAELAAQLRKEYKNEVCKKFHITEEQAKRVTTEGLRKNWPFPS